MHIATPPRRGALLRLVRVETQIALRSAFLAINTRIKGADSIYVAVADRIGVPLISWDGEHIARAATMVTVLSITIEEVR
jgi:predicted nucleic acid-binding protein